MDCQWRWRKQHALCMLAFLGNQTKIANMVEIRLDRIELPARALCNRRQEQRFPNPELDTSMRRSKLCAYILYRTNSVCVVVSAEMKNVPHLESNTLRSANLPEMSRGYSGMFGKDVQS